MLYSVCWLRRKKKKRQLPRLKQTVCRAILYRHFRNDVTVSRPKRMILVPLALILICNVVSTVSLAGKIAKEEEEEAVREAIREIREKKENKGKE